MGGIDDKGPVTADEEVRIREAYACRESPWSCGAAAAAARVPWALSLSRAELTPLDAKARPML